ncbi:hypothetical protein [Arthrobacter sp. N199823]|uniref:hypothetical protein n=1 Tax=Arthrobacter sp. N199823 TaxID=2058895 RepID=UPI000CE2DE4A|nr:hypothetical protein [Arthrobacter sp. N199823]
MASIRVRHRYTILAAMAVCASAALTGCASSTPVAGSPPSQSPESGDPGEWKLLAPDQVTPESTTLQLGVSRASCAGGVTGEVLIPQLTYEAGRITIRTDVAPLPDGAYTCQSNDFVPITVELQEAVGSRELFDALCLDSNRAGHSYCMDGGVRWAP